MAESTNSAETQYPFGLSEAEVGALIAFKEELNQQIPELFPEEMQDWGDQLLKTSPDEATSASPLDRSFLKIIDDYVFGDTEQQNTQAIQDLQDQFNALPDSVKAPIDTYKNFFQEQTSGTARQNQGQSVINQAQHALNTPVTETPEEGGLEVDETTSRALRETLKVLQQQNPDIEQDFNPRSLDGRAVDFMEELLKKRMEAANVPAHELNTTLIHIWSLQNADGAQSDAALSPEMESLGETAALFNLTDFMINGKLPNDTVTARPDVESPWDLKWTNDTTGDYFFNVDVYKALDSGENVISANLLFADTEANPNREKLMEIAKELGFSEDKEAFTKGEVGEIAKEYMLHRAEQEWCFIAPGEDFDPSKINAAIYNGDFMPHKRDLDLVEESYVSEYLKNNYELSEDMSTEERATYEFQLQNIDYDKLENSEEDYALAEQVQAYKNQGFVRDFGDPAEEAIKFKMESGWSRDEVTEHFGIPSQYFRNLSGVTGRPDADTYETMREEVYLPKLMEAIGDNQLGSCTPSADNDAACTVDGGDITSECGPIGTNGLDDGSGPCAVDDGVIVPECGKDFEVSAKADTSPDETIESTISDTCTVDADRDDLTCDPALFNQTPNSTVNANP